ncbi:MAG: putative metal-binding motif-containing protein [Myxococcota bacterium]
MLLLALQTALALDLPRECVAVGAPADARPYIDAVRDETTGVEEAGQAAMDLVEAWVDTSELTACATADTCWTGTTAAGAWVEYDEAVIDGSSGYDSAGSVVTHIVVEPPADAGETWTRLDVTQERTWADYGSSATSATEWTVSWVGVLDAEWPVDGAFTARSSEDRGSTTTTAMAWDDGTCAWSASSGEGSSVTVGTTEVLVTIADYCSGPWGANAWMDGVPYGFVDLVTWEYLGDDADGDGYAGTADCDDTDPSAHTCAVEIPYDGIDQDCDGADIADLDRDGWDSPADCDDTDRAVHPGAADTWYDGLDTDCAGDDDHDQDHDGAALADDCDDTDPARHPGAAEVTGDGIDQDCDGVDAVETDTAPEEEEPEEEPEEEAPEEAPEAEAPTEDEAPPEAAPTGCTTVTPPTLFIQALLGALLARRRRA